MVIAYALTPFVAGALAFIAEMTLWGHAGTYAIGASVNAGGSAPVHIARSMAMAAGLVAVFVTVFGALPIMSWLIGRGGLSLRTMLLWGAALGNAPFAVLGLLLVVSHLARGTMPGNPGDLWYGARGAFRTITEGIFVGTGCAAVFWAMAVRGTEVECKNINDR